MAWSARRKLLVGAAAASIVVLWLKPPQQGAAPVSKSPGAASLAPRAASAAMAQPEPPAASLVIAAVTRELGPGEIDICGLGLVQMQDDASSSSGPLDHLQHEAGVLAARALATKVDPRLRAAGLYYEARVALREADLDAAAPAANRLAALASDSRDPVVYALALQACRPPGPGSVRGACDQLSLAQWARLDPGNGVPWVFVADEAARRGDTAAEAEAYYRASQATAYDSGWGTLPSLIDEGVAETLAEPARSLVDFDAWLMQGGFGLPPVLGLTRFCDAAAVADANRRQVCEPIVALQARHGSFFDALVATGIAERAGWPEARASEARAELRSLMQADAVVAVGKPLAMDCASAQRLRERVRLDRELGEVAAARRRAERGDRP